MSADELDQLRQDYFALLDDVVGYRDAMVRDDLPGWLTNMNSLQNEINIAALSTGAQPPAWFIGPWPEAAPNARTHATAHGDLVLINTGIASVALVMGACGALLMSGDGGTAAELLWGLVRRNVAGEDARPLLSTVRLNDERLQQSRLLASYAVRYVACHEFGHIISGHTQEAHTRALLDIRRHWAKEGDVIWSQRLELDADTVSLGLLQALPTGNNALPPWFTANLSLLGPLLILSVHSLVIWFHWANGRFDVGDGHPPPDVRIASVMEIAPRFAPPEVLQSARAYLDWYEARRRELTVGAPGLG